MRVYLKHLFAILAFALLLAACEKEPYLGYNGQGKRPVYLPFAELGDITNLPEQPIEQTGTIYLLDTLFFLLEYKKGIHVYDLSDTSNSVYLTFLRIPAITDFTIAGQRIYADSWKDLVTIDISDLYHISEKSRVKDVIQPILFPQLYDGAFECADESKGVLVGWEDATLENARCFTN